MNASTASASAPLSWGAAFASAASVRPEGGDLNLDEVDEQADGGDGGCDHRDCGGGGGGGVAMVSQLARSVMATAKYDEGDNDGGETPPRPRPSSPTGISGRTTTGPTPSSCSGDDDVHPGGDRPFAVGKEGLRGKKRRRRKRKKKGKMRDGGDEKKKRVPAPEADDAAIASGCGPHRNADAKAAEVKRRRGSANRHRNDGGGDNECCSSSSENSADTDEPTYEGRMVPVGDDDGDGGGSDMIMVLIDRSTNIVYSSTEWTAAADDDDDDEDGGPGGRAKSCRLRVGRLVGGKVVLDSTTPQPARQHPRVGDGRGLDSDADEGTAVATMRRREVLHRRELMDFPYPTDPDDHCESPLEAYRHIAPLLRKLSTLISDGDSTSSSSLSIYDPYYCDGSVVERLGSLGFTDVYNRREDCYVAWGERDRPSAASSSSSSSSPPSLPPFDVLVTNPPYSGDHMERLVRFLTSRDFGDRAWFVLAPSWLHKKDYYVDALARAGGRDGRRTMMPLYVVPRRRYVYVPPRGFRSKRRSDTHKKSAPFASMWFVWGGTANRTELLARHFLKEQLHFEGDGCELARSKSALRDLRRKHKGLDATGSK